MLYLLEQLAAGTERAARQTLQTIDFAARLGAPFVVLHLGRVPIKPVTEPLIALAKAGEIYSREYVQRKVDAVAKREAAAPVYLANVKECLKPIMEHAAAKNIRLGIEGRRGYEEIPSEREIPTFSTNSTRRRSATGTTSGTSRSRKTSASSITRNGCAIGPRTLGCHVQDCVWPAQDHQPPFAGDVDLEKLVPLLPPACLLVWEMSPRKTVEEIRRSVTVWKERFGE